jgi:colanic acid biosynthesis glycosyl transferase WcaI
VISNSTSVDTCHPERYSWEPARGYRKDLAGSSEARSFANTLRMTNLPKNLQQYRKPRKKKLRDNIVIFSQVFVPDPASVGQHIADVAFELVRRGYKVRVYTADRGYDDPSVRYPRHEILKGVDVRRMPFSSFGKKSLFTRVLGTASFMAQAVFRGLLMPNLAGVLFSTSPPLIGIVATFIHMFRGVPLVYWAMDLNPDQLLALGKINRGGLVARFLEAGNKTVLQNSALIIALDRFMAQRLRSRAKLRDKLVIIPPWPHEQALEPVPHEANPFRAKLGLADKFVVMYSGNHSPSNPLTTLLDAAVRLKHDSSIRFVFVGGGIGKKQVEQYIAEHGLGNAVSLPYQPLADLRHSLSAADVHVVSLGNEMVGIIHPCKVYGAMAVARPILYFGPRPSHISDLLDTHQIGRNVRHGDVEGAIEAIRSLQQSSPQQRSEMGMTAQRVLSSSLSQSILCCRMCDGLELVFQKHR